jgi:hypothetical protein
MEQLRDSLHPRRLICEDSFSELAHRSLSETDVLLLSDHESEEWPPSQRLAQDLTFLSLPREVCRSRPADLTLSTAAQAVMRLLAGKLLGFSRSSLKYLYNNFLDCTAALEETPDERIVSLGRAPLHLIIGMAGLNRCSYRLGWPDDRRCAIFPEV